MEFISICELPFNCRYNMDVRIQAPVPPQQQSRNSSSSVCSVNSNSQHQNGPSRIEYSSTSYMNGGLTGVEHLPLPDRRNSLSALGGGGLLSTRLSLIQSHISVPGIRSGIPPPPHSHMGPIINQMSGNNRSV
jgi:hypothetical protein